MPLQLSTLSEFRLILSRPNNTVAAARWPSIIKATTLIHRHVPRPRILCRFNGRTMNSTRCFSALTVDGGCGFSSARKNTAARGNFIEPETRGKLVETSVDNEKHCRGICFAWSVKKKRTPRANLGRSCLWDSMRARSSRRTATRGPVPISGRNFENFVADSNLATGLLGVELCG